MTQLTNPPTTPSSLSPPVVNPPEASPAPKPRARRWVKILAGTLAIATLAGGLYWRLRPRVDPAIAFSGRLEGYETDVSTQGAGRVKEVTVREGATVAKGQVLVYLDDEEIQSELAAAISQVEAAQQREAAARLQISVLENQLADARLTLQQSEGDTEGKVAEAVALVATARAVVAQEAARVNEAEALRAEAGVDRDRFARLASLGAETQQRADLARTVFLTAQAAVQSREAAVVAARSAVDIAQRKLQRSTPIARTPMLAAFKPRSIRPGSCF
jgi:HlyD family secretion protein